jgi:Zn-dependent protease
MLDTGYLQLGRWRGVSIRAHWTVPLGALVFGGLRPVFWVAFFGLVFLHEMGHALFVKRFGHRVLSVDLMGFGGLCRWSGRSTQYERSVIAWGGVLAQAAVLLITLSLVAVFGWPQWWLAKQLVSVFVGTNAMLIAFNLLPIRPFDGADAWRLLPLLRARRG